MGKEGTPCPLFGICSWSVSWFPAEVRRLIQCSLNTRIFFMCASFTFNKCFFCTKDHTKLGDTEMSSLP